LEVPPVLPTNYAEQYHRVLHIELLRDGARERQKAAATPERTSLRRVAALARLAVARFNPKSRGASAGPSPSLAAR
jgi:hypothetical protein